MINDLIFREFNRQLLSIKLAITIKNVKSSLTLVVVSYLEDFNKMVNVTYL